LPKKACSVIAACSETSDGQFDTDFKTNKKNHAKNQPQLLAQLHPLLVVRMQALHEQPAMHDVSEQFI
jgi:hypothetical protein